MDERMDKTAFSIGRWDDNLDQARYGWSKTPEERLQAMELLRQINYGYEATSAPMKKVLEVVKRRRSGSAPAKGQAPLEGQS